MAAAEEGLPVSGARALARVPRQVRRRPRTVGRQRALAGGRRLAAAQAAPARARLGGLPKQPLGGPDAVLDYLGRYTHRVAISNERIVGVDGEQVALRVRADAGGGKKRTLRLPGVELIGRFLLHVLPPGFKRIRHYGLLSPARKRAGLAAARAALDVPAPSAATVESVADFLRRVARIEHARCPCCSSGQMHVVAVIPPAPRAFHVRGPP